MVVNVAAKSDIGCQRAKNEDSFFVDETGGLFIICDGMGGHIAGEVASQKAIEFAVSFLNKARRQRILPRRSDTDFLQVWSRLLIEAIEFCCDQLICFANSHPELEGMATTITVLLVVEGVAFVGHLGDSRLYLKHGDSTTQITNDHTLFAEFASSNPGWINSNNDPQAIKRFQHILTRCVGRPRDFEVDTYNFQVADKDVLLLCTDGLSNYFNDETTLSDFLEGDDAESVVQSLVDFANQNGGCDNITAIVVKVLSVDDSEVEATIFSP